MKVCHIISGDLWAGAEVMYVRLLQGLREYHGLEIISILFNDGKVAEAVRRTGIPVEIVDEVCLDIFQITRKIRKIVQRTSPDIIHSHRLKENMLAFFCRAKGNMDIPLLCTQHGIDEPLKDKFNLKRKILSTIHHYILKKHFACFITVSNDMKIHYLQKHHFEKNRVKVIYNGTDIEQIPRLKKNDGSFVIGSAGRLFPVKDYSYMVEIARKIKDKKTNVRFELAGDGPEREKILGAIRKYKLESEFILEGFVGDMSKFYQGLDLYINTSRHEGFPMSILEAMAHGLPIIAPNIGGIKELVIDEIHGYLIESRDPDAFATKCLRLFEDQELRQKMGAASRERVLRDFSSKKMAKDYFDVYSAILNKHKCNKVS